MKKIVGLFAQVEKSCFILLCF